MDLINKNTINELLKINNELKRDNDLAELKEINEDLYNLLCDDEINYCEKCKCFSENINCGGETGCGCHVCNCIKCNYNCEGSELNLCKREEELLKNLL